MALNDFWPEYIKQNGPEIIRHVPKWTLRLQNSGGAKFAKSLSILKKLSAALIINLITSATLLFCNAQQHTAFYKFWIIYMARCVP